MIEKEILEFARAAAHAAAREEWQKDGCTDRGECGGTVVMFDGRHKLTKAGIEMGLISRNGDHFLILPIPEDIRTQHATVFQAAAAAFVTKLEELGQGDAIKERWNYID